MESIKLTVKEEPEMIIPIIDSDDDGEDQSNSIVTSMSEDTTASETYMDTDCLNKQIVAALSRSSVYNDGIKTIELDILPPDLAQQMKDAFDAEYLQKQQRLGSNAQSMRNYRSRIRADPIRYEAYKERERIRNKRRCERRRLERLAKKSLRNSNGNQSTECGGKIMGSKQLTDEIKLEMIDGNSASNDETNFKLDPLTESVDYGLNGLFADLEKIANKRLPTKEITISRPREKTNKRKRSRERIHNRLLPEIDMFINDPTTLARVPINGLSILTNIANELNAPATSVPKKDLPIANDDSVVDLTALSDDADGESSERDILHLNTQQLEPEIEILEFPPLPPTVNQSRNHVAQAAITSKLTGKSSSGYINSFVTFVSRKIEEEEREMAGRTKFYNLSST